MSHTILSNNVFLQKNNVNLLITNRLNLCFDSILNIFINIRQCQLKIFLSWYIFFTPKYFKTIQPWFHLLKSTKFNLI